jgi:hypothetical protein
MIEDWACLTTQDVTPYAEICNEAVESDEVFAKFKQDPRYTAILEHVSPEHGQRYFNGIAQYELDEEIIEQFKENDKLGGSRVVDYGEPFGLVSPSTLRYVQNTLDIGHFVGEGDINKIVEIGGGYGGLCKSISCLCDFDEYNIYDVEPASRLQQKYLSNFDVGEKVTFHSSVDPIEDVDLVISNYAYSELNLDLQNAYYENVIKNAKRVYMILNRGEVSREVLLERAREDFDVTVDKVLDFWPPNGYLYYTTMIKK